MPLKQFLLYTILGTTAWNTVLVSLGRIVGNNWKVISNIIDSYTKIVLLAIVVIITIIIVKKKKLKC